MPETGSESKSVYQTLQRSIITGLLMANMGMWLYALNEGLTKWRLILLVLAGGALLTWLILQLPQRQVLRSSGRVHAQDTTLRLAIEWNDGHTGSFSQHEVTAQQFVSWCIGVGTGRSLGETHWTGEGAPFTKSQYIRFRDNLLFEGLIRQRGGHYTRGFELTEKGAAMCREVIRRYPPHPRKRSPVSTVITKSLRARE
jgi:hypothetical protein